MTDRALSEETLFSALHGLRLPEAAPGGSVAEGLAALGLGLLLAACLCAALAPILTRRPSRDIYGSPEARQMALLRALKRKRPARFRALVPDPYGRAPLPDEATIRRALE